MKKVVVSLSSLALLFGAVIFPASTQAAAKNCVTIYDGKNFKGKSATFCYNVQDLKTFKFDNKMSSYKIKVASNVQVHFHHNANYKGGGFFVNNYTHPESKDLPIESDNAISSISFRTVK